MDKECPSPDICRNRSTRGGRQQDQVVCFSSDFRNRGSVDRQLQILFLVANWANQGQSSQARVEMLDTSAKPANVAAENETNFGALVDEMFHQRGCLGHSVFETN